MIKYFKNYLENYVNNSKFITSFLHGDSYDVVKSGEDTYPMLFLETPWRVNYVKGAKTLSVSLLVIDAFQEGIDYIEVEEKIESLSDLILMDLELSGEFDIKSANSLIMREFSNDGCVCARIEISIEFLRDKNLCLIS